MQKKTFEFLKSKFNVYFLDKILITSFINKENPTTSFPVNSFATVNPDRGFGLLKNKALQSDVHG